MKKWKFVVVGVCLAAYTYIGYAVTHAPVTETHPAPGLTCIWVKSIWGKKTAAGCYTGDIRKPDNKFDTQATQKYQS